MQFFIKKIFLILIIIEIIILSINFFLDETGIHHIKNLQIQLNYYKKIKNKKLAAIALLEKALENKNNNFFYEKIAREELLMCKPGESIYFIKK